jgi:hypothetical protein
MKPRDPRYVGYLDWLLERERYRKFVDLKEGEPFERTRSRFKTFLQTWVDELRRRG